MVELFLLGCTGVVVFLHGANFFFHALSHHMAIRSLSFHVMPVLTSFKNYGGSWELGVVEAAVAYDEAARTVYGYRAKLNFPGYVKAVEVSHYSLVFTTSTNPTRISALPVHTATSKTKLETYTAASNEFEVGMTEKFKAKGECHRVDTKVKPRIVVKPPKRVESETPASQGFAVPKIVYQPPMAVELIIAQPPSTVNLI
ncbi:hypothetical protein RJ639_024111 [Escallonia herrerae]|uniref:AP2/ERF domain-containing protein n=1 Tax=Escallonia herrerae TaxID=1293975 RepID=A0AA88UYL5_9ASTE|nr:hypothetical protein RJ639_024111 [Escallonia herrerae]